MRRKRKSSPLPMRNGISPHSVYLPEGPWTTVLAFLSQRFPAVSAQHWAQRMTLGEVVSEKGEALLPDQPYLPNSRIHYYRSVENEQAVPFADTILYEDEHILVVDKPHFLPTQPAGAFLQETLITRLRQRTGDPLLEPLHRLDRETAGLVLISRQPATRDAYHRLFRECQLQKVYLAIAPIHPDLTFPLNYQSRIEVDEAFFRRREQPGEPNSETRIELMQTRNGWGCYRLLPRTGKTHQLRVHMAALGIPIRHDPLYPVDIQRAADDFNNPLQLLAQELAFEDPLTGQSHRFQSRLTLDW